MRCEKCNGTGHVMYRESLISHTPSFVIELCPDCDGAGEMGCCEGDPLPQPMPEKKE